MEEGHIFVCSFEKPAGIVGMRVGVPANGVDAHVDSAIDKPARHDIPDRILFAESSIIKSLVNVTVTLYDNGPCDQLLCVHNAPPFSEPVQSLRVLGDYLLN
jgi:hypothetical protein